MDDRFIAPRAVDQWERSKDELSCLLLTLHGGGRILRPMREAELTVDGTGDSIYEAPELRVLGQLEMVTFGQADGEYTDESFPVNTKRSDLTFS